MAEVNGSAFVPVPFEVKLEKLDAGIAQGTTLTIIEWFVALVPLVLDMHILSLVVDIDVDVDVGTQRMWWRRHGKWFMNTHCLARILKFYLTHFLNISTVFLSR